MKDRFTESAGSPNGYAKLLVETAADAIIGADARGRIVLWNQASTALFGFDAGEMLGEPVSRLIPDRYVSDYERGFAAAIATGKPQVSYITLRGRHADGREFPLEVAVSLSGRGNDATAFGVVRRVGERFQKLARLQDSERRLREAEHLANFGSFEWDVRGDSLTWSDELSRIFGFEPALAPQSLQTFLERVHPDDRETLQYHVQRAMTTGEGWSIDERILRADTGEERTLVSTGKALLDARGNVARLYGTCHDVTEQRRAERRLIESEARFRHGFDDAPIGMALFDLHDGDGAITRTNKALTYLIAYTQLQLDAMHLSEIVAAEDWPLLQATLERVLHDTSAPAQLEVRLRAADGRQPVVIAAASRIRVPGNPQAMILHLKDITKRKVAENQLRHRALHDSLTGLPNRDLLLDRLAGALSRAGRANASVAVLFLDLDNFKLINDTIGHAAGDDMLRTVASRLGAACRGGDTAARVGGDEFVMVCENVVHEEEVYSLARRVSDALAAPISINDSDFISTVSIGIAVGHENTHSPEQLLRDADLAMYRAKQHGKNTIEVFDEALRLHALERVDIERQLRAALQHGQIVANYQPVCSLESGEIRGFEALARWSHSERGLLHPKEFLSVAEDAHLIAALGRIMLYMACAQLREWRKRLAGLTMAVNVSLRQLDGHFAGVLEECLAEHGLPADALHVEVTESVLLDISKPAGADLDAMAKLGVCIGLDDFGTGYSSLLYIKRFPVSFLKIDRSFVDGLPHDPEDTAIVEAIVRLGQSLGLETIAEGVETAEQLAALKALRCTAAQGYYIARPLPPEACPVPAP